MDCLALALKAIARRDGVRVAKPTYTLSTNDAADLVGCSVRAIRYAIAAGHIEATIDQGKWRLCRASVVAYSPGIGRPRGGFSDV